MRRSPINAWRDEVRDSGLHSTAKLVAFVLSTYSNGNGSAYPSRSTLARGAGVSIHSVDRALKQAELAGFFAKRKGGGRTHPNTYTLLLNGSSVAAVHQAQQPQGAPRLGTPRSGPLLDEECTACGEKPARDDGASVLCDSCRAAECREAESVGVAA